MKRRNTKTYHPKRRRLPRHLVRVSSRVQQDFPLPVPGHLKILTKQRWAAILDFWGQRCAYCGTGLDILTKDHVVSKRRHGETHVGNIVPACPWCNEDKAHCDLHAWMEERGHNYEAFLAKLKRQIEVIE